MVITFLMGLFCLFFSYGFKWGRVLYPIYLSVGLLLFSVLCISNEHFLIGILCLVSMISYLLYLILDYKFGDRSNKENPPEWLSNIGIYPVCIALVSLLFLPRDYVTFQNFGDSNNSEEVYYQNCSEVKSLGIALIYRNDSGYRNALDRDDDGVACE